MPVIDRVTKGAPVNIHNNPQTRQLSRSLWLRLALMVVVWSLFCALFALTTQDFWHTVGEAVARTQSPWQQYPTADYNALVEHGLFNGEREYQVQMIYDAAGEPTYYVRDITIYEQLRALKGPLALGAYLLGLLVMAGLVLRRSIGYYAQLTGAVAQLAANPEDPVRLSGELSVTEQELNQVRCQRIAADKAAHAAEHRKDELVTYLAHDLRTPMTSVIGYLDLLCEAPELPNDAKERYIAIARDRAVRLEGLVEELFEITRFNLQTIPLERQEVDLAMLAEQVADEAYPDACDHHLTIKVTAQEGAICSVDPERIARMLGNLLRNAVAHATPHTEISVAVTCTSMPQGPNVPAVMTPAPGAPTPPAEAEAAAMSAAAPMNGHDSEGAASRGPEAVELAVADHGPDIPPELIPHVFERFVRGDESRGQEGGTGLGLSIVQEIVQAHEGLVSVESGGGTTVFRVFLPKTPISAGDVGALA